MIERTEIDEEEALLPERTVTDDLELLLAALPLSIRQTLETSEYRPQLLEVVMDLGRKPEARYQGGEVALSQREVTQEDLDFVVSRIGTFGEDNRAGIERTLHRISCIRNRSGRVIGLTMRIGRAVFGTISIIQDLVESSKSILLVGRPGIGKTTLLRETARVLADDLHKRVVIVDTSNEIAGDGDIPHPAIGRARRMQVARPDLQHNVMIEAVENHMPQVIVIDEIGTALEAEAARTIAERGVQLIGTAHGISLENLMLNPTLSDLIGGIQTVTLGDEEARRRGTQKSVLERKAPPTFDVMVEIRDRDRVAVHLDVAETVDAILRGQPFPTQIRFRNESGQIEIYTESENVSETAAATNDFLGRGNNGTNGNLGYPYASYPHSNSNAYHYEAERGARATNARRNSAGAGFFPQVAPVANEPELLRIAPPAPTNRFSKENSMPVSPAKPLRIYPHGVNRTRLEQVISHMHLPADIVKEVGDADMVLTLKNYYRQKPLTLRQAESDNTPIYILKSNTAAQMESCLADIFNVNPPAGAEEELLPKENPTNNGDPVKAAMYETEEAITKVMQHAQPIELAPQNSFIRRMQHEMAERYNLTSQSRGREPFRRVRILPHGD